MRILLSPENTARDDGPPRRRHLLAWTALATPVLSAVVLVGLTVGTREASGPARPAPPPAARPVAAPPASFAWVLDPRPALPRTVLTLGMSQPIPAVFQRVQTSSPAAAPIPVSGPVRSAALAAEPVRTAAAVPLPPPRPAELAASAAPRVANRTPSRRARVAAAAAAPPDNRTFFEKLFGLPASPAPPGLAYAALSSAPVASAPARRISPMPGPAAEAGIAVYDISARTVTLPSGERLEAHSGLRDKLDDPRFVHVRMHGATPPGTYDLTEREAPFHGVRALRLNPVGGSGTVFGRTGLLAHTYLLGPNGDSNGCMSVRDYDRFLQAYLRGEIRRLVVVPGNGWSGPTVAGRARGGGGPLSLRGGDA
jgi:hypothetical protein